MEKYIEEQKEILNDKIDKSLESLKEGLNNLNLATFRYQYDLVCTVRFLKDEKENELLNYIFQNFTKDDKDGFYKGDYFRSHYLLFTSILQDHFLERSNEFDSLCRAYLGSNYDSYKSLSVFE
uniref:hypothetical protein n=1 Tax=Gelidibacter sp. TaxID=2018083 RepID=UPI00404B2D6E